MNTITIDRAVVEQALEALKYLHEEKCNYMRRNNLGDPLRENAARLALPAITTLRAALAQQAEPDLSRCPQCNGPADNGFDRSFPPSPYLCKKCMAEPVEPVAWLVMDESGYVQHAASWRDAAHEHINDAINEHDLVCARTWRVVPVYTTPSQRLPLTDEEILKAIGWERAEMYMKLTPNFPVAEAKKETLKNARAVEKASWEKNYGQA